MPSSHAVASNKLIPASKNALVPKMKAVHMPRVP